MRKLLFFFIFLLLTGGNSVVISFAYSDNCEAIDMPIGDGEENSEEEKNFSEEDDDEVGLDHRLMSKEKSTDSNLHFLYQETLFNDLEIEVIIPPPKA